VNVLQFIAAVVSSIAWPAAALGMTALLRGPLAGLLPFQPDWKYGDLEFDFQRELSEISEMEAHAQAASLGDRPATVDDLGDLIAEVDAVAAISPLASIPLAWIVVENEINKSLTRLEIQVRSLRRPAQSIQALVREGYIGRETETVLNRLRQLRNKAVHAAHTRIHISRSGAAEYARLATEVVGVLRGLQRGEEDAT
jgi:hypothetical protein